METNYPDSKDKNSPESGAEFEDYCMDLFRTELGIHVQVYKSRRYQISKGESAQGVEFKLDTRCTDTGRLSIEIAEKTNASHRYWTDSGIKRQDNTWLYVQGTYGLVYVFPKKYLVFLHDSKRYQEHDLPTLRGFYLPLQDAERYAAIRLPKKGASS